MDHIYGLFQNIIIKKREQEAAKAKPEKCDKGHSMSHTTLAKPRECSDGDFNMGEDITCKVCKGPIVLSEGYFTCMDACDFDLHKQCYGGAQFEEQDLNCPYGHPMLKRIPGFTKRLKAVRGEEVQQSQLQV